MSWSTQHIQFGSIRIKAVQRYGLIVEQIREIIYILIVIMVSIGSRRSKMKKWVISASRLALVWVGAILLLIFCFIWLVATASHPKSDNNHHQMGQHDKTTSRHRKDIQRQQQNIRLEPTELVHEKRFRDTIKSCLPSENPKCKEFIPNWIGAEQHKVQRVALISPPGEISSSLAHRIDEIINKHNNRVGKLDIELIQTSHVPPYGYGKTHGLTRILRLIPQPLILEVTDALRGVLQPDNNDGDGSTGVDTITLDDLKMALKQVLRLHCRLSHVAAHTALLSVSFLELQSDPARTIEKIRAFLAPQELREGFHNTTLNENQVLLRTEMAYAIEILSSVQARSEGIDIMQELDQVLVEEMKITKDMTIWPCLSFWDPGNKENDKEQQQPPLSPITQRIARALSPDCDDHYTTCFVERDKCEFHGDALCKRLNPH
jgi:hypothetical protein